jgi:hypothetical protein
LNPTSEEKMSELSWKNHVPVSSLTTGLPELKLTSEYQKEVKARLDVIYDDC